MVFFKVIGNICLKFKFLIFFFVKFMVKKWMLNGYMVRNMNRWKMEKFILINLLILFDGCIIKFVFYI